MYRIAFIIPYFGKLPDYFSEWLQSVRQLEKQSIDFLIFSDDNLNYELPSNVRLTSMTFESFRKRIQERFDFPIVLDNAYKICDYRPAFGTIFEEELRGYDFWGNCDFDQVWGDIRGFLTEDVLRLNEKILYLGHCSLYKNNDKMNKLFMKNGSAASYKEVFSSDGFYAFDEFSGMVAICKKNDVKTFFSVIYADIAVQHSRITLRKTRNYNYQIVYFHEGKVYRSFVDERGAVITEEFLYFHFQKRNPVSLRAYQKNISTFMIKTNSFEEFDIDALSPDFVRKHSEFISVSRDKIDEIGYKIKKIVRFCKSSVADKRIWLRRKIGAVNIEE